MDAVARSPGEGKASGAELMLISGENWEILFVKAAPKHSQPQKYSSEIRTKKATWELEVAKESDGK